MIEPEDLNAITEALAPVLEQLLTQTTEKLRAEQGEWNEAIINQIELLAQQITVNQMQGTDIEAATKAWREFVIGEAKKLLVKPSELRADARSSD